jgi:hypothetical protein
VTELESRLDIVERKIKVLEDLEKRLALAVIDVMPATVHNVSGYDIGTVRTAMGIRWVWKHFLRGTRSAATFETRDACVKSAQADSLKHLAFPTNDIASIIHKEKERGPHRHRLDAILPNAREAGLLRTRRS